MRRVKSVIGLVAIALVMGAVPAHAQQSNDEDGANCLHARFDAARVCERDGTALQLLRPACLLCHHGTAGHQLHGRGSHALLQRR